MHSRSDCVRDEVGGPLSGIRVVALEHSVAGPLATRLLAELGADVMKIERPGAGDFARHWDHNVAGEGAQFWWLNRGKRSIAIDLKAPGARSVLNALLAEADVLLHNLAPPSASRLGLDGATIAAEFPRLVNCQISGYGADGPAIDRKAYDMLVQAEAGVMSLTGTPEQPMRVGVSISDVSTGLYSALLVLAALHERARTGVGRHLDLAMMDVTLEFLGPMLTSYLNAGTVYPRIPDQHHAIAPYGVFLCADGQRLLIAVEQDQEWHRLCEEVLDDSDLSNDPRYAGNLDRLARREELHEELSRRFAALTAEQALDRLARASLAYARLNDVAGVARHDVVAHRQLIADGASADGTPVSYMRGTAERLFARPRPERNRPPALGEDTDAVLGALGGKQDRAGLEKTQIGER